MLEAKLLENRLLRGLASSAFYGGGGRVDRARLGVRIGDTITWAAEIEVL